MEGFFQIQPSWCLLGLNGYGAPVAIHKRGQWKDQSHGR